MKHKLLALLAATGMALALSAPDAHAGTATYTISGATNGTFDGTSFTDEAFTFTLVGATANFINMPFFEQLNPLTSATVTLAGLGTFTVEQPTSLGMDSGGESALDQYEPNQRNVFIFDVSPVNFERSFAPESSTLTEIVGDVIPTSGGDLQFTGTGAVANPVLTLAGTVTGVPEPASWALMLSGLGLCGAVLRSRPRGAGRVTNA